MKRQNTAMPARHLRPTPADGLLGQALHEESKDRTHEVIAEKTKTCGNILFRESDLFLYQKFITGCGIYNFSRNLPEIYGTRPWAEIYGVPEKHRPCPGTATRN